DRIARMVDGPSPYEQAVKEIFEIQQDFVKDVLWQPRTTVADPMVGREGLERVAGRAMNLFLGVVNGLLCEVPTTIAAYFEAQRTGDWGKFHYALGRSTFQVATVLAAAGAPTLLKRLPKVGFRELGRRIVNRFRNGGKARDNALRDNALGNAPQVGWKVPPNPGAKFPTSTAQVGKTVENVDPLSL